MKKRYQTKSISQIKKQSICKDCKYGYFYESEIFYFKCEYVSDDGSVLTPRKRPISIGQNCEYRESR